jgi:putative membrane protein
MFKKIAFLVAAVALAASGCASSGNTNRPSFTANFFFGVLWARPVFEVSVRYLGIPRRVAYYTVIEFILAFSAFYELFEWGL